MKARRYVVEVTVRGRRDLDALPDLQFEVVACTAREARNTGARRARGMLTRHAVRKGYAVQVVGYVPATFGGVR